MYIYTVQGTCIIVCVYTRNHKISVHPKKHEVQPSKSKIVVREECDT